MMRRALFALALIASPAAAQVVTAPAVTIDTSNLATKAEVAGVQAAIPTPANTVGGGEMVGGAVGSSMAYKRGDWVPPRISRTGSCTLNASGTCTASWTVAFPGGVAPVMFGDPVPVNSTATFPISCNVTAAPTATSVPVKCWQGQSSVISVLGATVLPFNATLLTGVVVTVSAIPPVQ